MDLQDNLQEVAQGFLKLENDEFNRSSMQSDMNKVVQRMYPFYSGDPILVSLTKKKELTANVTEGEMVVNIPTILLEYIIEEFPAHCI